MFLKRLPEESACIFSRMHSGNIYYIIYFVLQVLPATALRHPFKTALRHPFKSAFWQHLLLYYLFCVLNDPKLLRALIVVQISDLCVPALVKLASGNRPRLPTAMTSEIRFNSNNASTATTWVCKIGSCHISSMGEVLDGAMTKGISIGLHVESRSIVAHFPEPHSAQNARGKLEVILCRGGAAKRSIEEIESLDLYHGERWGLIAVNAPQMPKYLQRLIEEDDFEMEETPDGAIDAPSVASELPSDAVSFGPDLFEMVTRVELKDIVVPGMIRALVTETLEQKQLRITMLQGGPLTEYIEKLLFSRGNRHVQQVQGDARALAKTSTDFSSIMWLTSPPVFIAVCVKPNMHTARRVEWIVWKASKLSLELTRSVFMALF